MIPRHRRHKEEHGNMAQRGVTRPDMAGEQEVAGTQQAHQTEMAPEHREQMRNRHHQQTLWAPLAVMGLGAWLATSPFTFGYGQGPLVWSDLVSGCLLMVLGAAWCKTPRHPTVPWAACFIGVWLQIAPLIFWGDPVAYVTDTLVGTWVIALTILVRGMPNMIMMMEHGPQVPRGWTYNPSSWPQRAPLIGTALIGWLISRYLAGYQLGYIQEVWDPFFGEGTRRVLGSEVSRSWPISDAGFGAFAYTIETMMGLMGGVARWRTMPWMVLFFGILVIPLGLVHIALVILQPVVVGHWCSLCLAAAAVMLVMIPLTADEVVAMGQFLKQSRAEGKPFWKTFWKGGTIPGEGMDERSPAVNASAAKLFPAMFWGVSFPWYLLASSAAGLWLMFAPSVLGTVGAAADSNRVVGALVLTFSVIATAEVLRPVRFVNVFLGAWILVSPWILTGFEGGASWSNWLVGLILILLSVPRGQVREKYGAWKTYIV